MLSTTAAAQIKAPKFTDTCLNDRKPFSRIKNFQSNQILAGAGLGLLLGVGAGLLNNAGQRDKSSILPEALIGAAAGGAVGYLGSIAQDQRNKDELRAAIEQDFAPTFAQYSDLPARLQALGQCRRDQIAQVETGLTSSAIDRKEAARELTLVEKWIVEDDRIIAKAAGAQAKTITTFAQANAMADGADLANVQQESEAMSYYGLDGINAQIASTNQKASTHRFVDAVSGARLRVAPSGNATVKATVAHGAAVSTLGYPADGWAQVRIASGEIGYISTSLLRDDMAAKPAVVAKSGKARVAKAKRMQQDFASAQQREKSATATRLAAARSLLAGA
jgi:hypothetical protein